MKAVIVELNKDRAAVLSDDGCIVTIKNNNYAIGQVIQLKNAKQKITKKLTVFAASAAAFVVLSVGTWAYASPYTYVSVDVNPSIEFTLNRFDRVLKVKAVNDDGEAILNQIPLKKLTNEPIQNAIETTVDQLSEAGYFDGDTEGGIVIATSSEDTDKADELADELQTSVEQVNEENGDSVAVETFSVAPERVKEAKELGVTPGKLNLVEKLQEAAGDTADVNRDEWLNKPVKEIMKATKDYKKTSKDADKNSSKDSTDSDASAIENQDQPDSQDSDNLTNSNDDKQIKKEEDKALKNAEKEQKSAVKEADKEQKQTAKQEDKSKKTDKKDKSSDAAVQQDTNNTADLTDNSSGKKTEPAQKTDQSTDKKSSKSTEKKDQPTKDEDKEAPKNDVDSNNPSDTGNNVTDQGSEEEPGSENQDVNGSQGSDNSGLQHNQNSNNDQNQGSQGSENNQQQSGDATPGNQGADISAGQSDQGSSHSSDNNGQSSNNTGNNGQGSDNSDHGNSDHGNN